MGSEEFADAWLIYSKKEENTNMTEKRVLTGYSKDVQADFERLKKDSTYPLLAITGGLETLDSLRNLIVSANSNEDRQILQDIADLINEKAEFPEEKHIYKLKGVFTQHLCDLYIMDSRGIELTDAISNAEKLTEKELSYALVDTPFTSYQFAIAD